MAKKEAVYDAIIRSFFRTRYKPGVTEFAFPREDIIEHAQMLGVERPRNVGDLVYTFRYRRALPDEIRQSVPPGQQWVILPAGIGAYLFRLERVPRFEPNPDLVVVKVPDATPAIIARYALSDEQALLARLRYNRLIDIFTRLTCYSLQSHLRTTVADMGQVETDEVYVGLDHEGAHYVVPVQAKGGRDRLSVVQIRQDMALCAQKFPDLVCRPIGAQFLSGGAIALFELTQTDEGIQVVREKHYKLVPSDELTAEDLRRYRMMRERLE